MGAGRSNCVETRIFPATLASCVRHQSVQCCTLPIVKMYIAMFLCWYLFICLTLDHWQLYGNPNISCNFGFLRTLPICTMVYNSKVQHWIMGKVQHCALDIWYDMCLLVDIPVHWLIVNCNCMESQMFSCNIGFLPSYVCHQTLNLKIDLWQEN